MQLGEKLRYDAGLAAGSSDVSENDIIARNQLHQILKDDALHLARALNFALRKKDLASSTVHPLSDFFGTLADTTGALPDMQRGRVRVTHNHAPDNRRNTAYISLYVDAAKNSDLKWYKGESVSLCIVNNQHRHFIRISRFKADGQLIDHMDVRFSDKIPPVRKLLAKWLRGNFPAAIRAEARMVLNTKSVNTGPESQPTSLSIAS